MKRVLLLSLVFGGVVVYACRTTNQGSSVKETQDGGTFGPSNTRPPVQDGGTFGPSAGNPPTQDGGTFGPSNTHPPVQDGGTFGPANGALRMAGSGWQALSLTTPRSGNLVQITFPNNGSQDWTGNLYVNGNEFSCDNCTGNDNSGPWNFGLGQTLAVQTVQANLGNGNCAYTVNVMTVAPTQDGGTFN